MLSSRQELEQLVAAAAADARSLGACDALMCVVQVRSALADNVPAAVLALATARMVQAMADTHFNMHLQDAWRGQKVLEGAKDGCAAVHGSEEERNRLYVSYQQAVDEKHLERPDIKSWRQLSRLIAGQFGCCSRTIRRHTENPLKNSGTGLPLSHFDSDIITTNRPRS